MGRLWAGGSFGGRFGFAWVWFFQFRRPARFLRVATFGVGTGGVGESF